MTIIAYPVSPVANVSRTYTLTANGTPIHVEQFAGIHYAHFAFDGECDVAISIPPSIGHRNLKYIHAYTIQPARREPRSSTELNTLTFKLSEPAKFVIRINEHERLFVFADAIDANVPKVGAPGVVNATDFVTDAFGKTLQTEQIQRAIDATPKGGVLYFGPGDYLTGTFSLKSDMTLYLAGGAALGGSPAPADYPIEQASPYWSKVMFVRIADAQNVTIRGHGVIDGNGSMVRAANGWPHLLIARDCQNVVIQDIHVRDAAAWTLHAINCEHITLRNIKMVNNWDVLNTDGVDPTSCRHMLVEDCFVHSSDDGVVVKSFEHKPCDHIMVTRNIVINKKSALKIGTETHGDVSNVTFSDNDVVVCDRGMVIYIEDGATVTDTKFINNRFEGSYPDARRRLIDFYTWDRNGDKKGGGKVRGVLIKDCVVDTKWEHPSTMLNGFGVIDSVRFENFMVEGKVCRTLREADVLIDVLPCNDMRKPGVNNVSFSPSDSLKTWNMALRQ